MMVKIVSPDLPPEYDELWKKIFRWFELHGVPVWAGMFFQTSRSQKNRRRESTKFPAVADAWNNLSDAERIAWEVAVTYNWDWNNGYVIFLTDYIYRLQHNLSVPGTPSNFHQLFGLIMDNPSGASNVYMRRDDKDLVGPVEIKFSYKKDERTPSGSYAFKVQSTAYFFEGGQIKTCTDEFVAPAGNVSWNVVTRTFGTSGQKYFHLKVVFTIQSYDAKIYLDNIIWSDQVGEFFREHFDIGSYKEWTPTMLYRKKDWYFNPAYITTYFNHEYLL